MEYDAAGVVERIGEFWVWVMHLILCEINEEEWSGRYAMSWGRR
jgi:hypothetical protein